jgi:hypothetical protein
MTKLISNGLPFRLTETSRDAEYLKRCLKAASVGNRNGDREALALQRRNIEEAFRWLAHDIEELNSLFSAADIQ